MQSNKFFIINFLLLSIYNIGMFFFQVHTKEILPICVFFIYAIVSVYLLGWATSDYIKIKRGVNSLSDQEINQIANLISNAVVNTPIKIDSISKAKEYVTLVQFMEKKCTEIKTAMDVFCSNLEKRNKL